MPTPAYLTIEGETQGAITKGASTPESVGNIFQDGHEDEILVQAFDHEVQVPVDSQSGTPTGFRLHKPMTITKVFDKSTPMLYNALAKKEPLKCELKWFRTSPKGDHEHYFTTALEEAYVTNIQAVMPNCQDPSQSHFTHMEKVSFSYTKITWTHEAGTSGDDNWREQV
jgi:type VI secretion system secreted protein Hcp